MPYRRKELEKESPRLDLPLADCWLPSWSISHAMTLPWLWSELLRRLPPRIRFRLSARAKSSADVFIAAKRTTDLSILRASVIMLSETETMIPSCHLTLIRVIRTVSYVAGIWVHERVTGIVRIQRAKLPESLLMIEQNFFSILTSSGACKNWPSESLSQRFPGCIVRRLSARTHKASFI